MDKEEASREIADLLIKVVNRYNALERHAVSSGPGGRVKLYHSERHMIDVIGSRPAMNVTEFAVATRVTKGARIPGYKEA